MYYIQMWKHSFIHILKELVLKSPKGCCIKQAVFPHITCGFKVQRCQVYNPCHLNTKHITQTVQWSIIQSTSYHLNSLFYFPPLDSQGSLCSCVKDVLLLQSPYLKDTQPAKYHWSRPLEAFKSQSILLQRTPLVTETSALHANIPSPNATRLKAGS